MANITISVTVAALGTVSTTAEFSEEVGIEILQTHATRWPADTDEKGEPLPKDAKWIVGKMFGEIIGNVLGTTLQIEKQWASERAAAAVETKAVTVT